MDNADDREHLRLKIALDATDTGVWEWDLRTDEVVWDERMERLFGYDPGEFPGTYQGFATRVHPDDLPSVEEAHERGMEEGFYEASFRVIVDSELVRWVKARAEVVSDNDEPSRMIGIVTDITDEKEAEVQLKTQNDKLEEFADIVSHDLRNPLNVAQLSLKLLVDECESEHIDRIANAHERMERLIEELLAVSREGNHGETTEPVKLSELAETSWGNVGTVNATLRTETTHTLLANRSSLQQLFENLFRNAVEHGGPAVTVTVGDLPAGFYIEDDGPGVPEGERTDVWARGYSTNQDGNGFGLYIIKQIADAHGWSIRLTDSGTGGARFEVTAVETEC